MPLRTAQLGLLKRIQAPAKVGRPQIASRDVEVAHPATESFAASKLPGAHFREEECNLVAFFLTPTAGSAGLPLGNRQRRTSCSVGGRFELR